MGSEMCIRDRSVPYWGVEPSGVGYIALTSFTDKSPEEVREALEAFKKNPEVLTNIGHAFDFQINDTVNAFKYIDRALAVNPKYVPAYVEKGSILFGWAKTPEDTITAYGWYDKAISFDPKNPLGYQAYAKALAKKHDYDGAAKKLEEILQHDPNYNVYVEIGAMYGLADVEYASKAILSLIHI